MNGLLRRLLIWQKLAIFGLLGIAVALPPMVMYLVTSNAGIRLAQRESAGIEPSKALLRVIQYTQQHRGISAGLLGGNSAMSGQREQAQIQVDKLLEETDAILGGGVNKESKIVAHWKHATQNWKSLAQDVAQKNITGAQSFAQHTALVAEYLALVDQAADEFGLSLDPDADSFFLITAVLINLPNLTESLGQARALGARFLAQKTVAMDDRTALSTVLGLAKFHLRNMKLALGKVGALNPTISAALAEPMKQSAEATERAIRLTEEQILTPEKLSFEAGEYFKTYTGVIDTLFALNTSAMAELNDVVRGRKDRMQNFQHSVFGFITLIVLIAGAVGYAVSRSITLPMVKAVALARRVAGGDLSATVEVNSRDEIGQLLQALKDMNENLVKIVGEVRSGTEAIGTGIKEIAMGNADLSQRTEEQASALEETASSMEELTSTVKQNAENAGQANQLAIGASAVAVKGGKVVGDVVRTMGSINESSKKIADIISVIDGIAFQTNILALNAAVEAARAGEQGRGFAVVATEVGNLAQRSAAAAKEIKALIGDSVEKVGTGSKLVDEAGKTMDEIVSSVKRVTDIMSEITAASREQSSGIEQVNQAITQMDEVTQQNAALVEEAAAAAESLEEQAQNLEAVVAVFNLGKFAASAVAGRSMEVVHRAEKPARTLAAGREPAAQRASRFRGL